MCCIFVVNLTNFTQLRISFTRGEYRFYRTSTPLDIVSYRSKGLTELELSGLGYDRITFRNAGTGSYWKALWGNIRFLPVSAHTGLNLILLQPCPEAQEVVVGKLGFTRTFLAILRCAVMGLTCPVEPTMLTGSDPCKGNEARWRTRL